MFEEAVEAADEVALECHEGGLRRDTLGPCRAGCLLAAVALAEIGRVVEGRARVPRQFETVCGGDRVDAPSGGEAAAEGGDEVGFRTTR